jgi:hypothetical protein
MPGTFFSLSGFGEAFLIPAPPHDPYGVLTLKTPLTVGTYPSGYCGVHFFWGVCRNLSMLGIFKALKTTLILQNVFRVIHYLPVPHYHLRMREPPSLSVQRP